MTSRIGTAAVTGSSGYLGSRICDALEKRGWTVIRLQRSPTSGDASERRYVMDAPVGARVLEGVDLLVHAAYDFAARTREDIWRVNVDGTRRLLDAAAASGIDRIVVISTMSAYEGTKQLYGRAKLEIERYAAAVNGCAVRPGLVYGPEPAGMAGALLRASRLPIVPLIGGGAHQFTVHLDDLLQAITSIASAERLPPEPVGIAHPEPITFRDVMAGLAALEGRRCRFVPIPWQAAYGGLRVLERLGLRPAFRADSLLGLVHPAPRVPGAEELARLGIRLRPFPRPTGD